MPTATAPIAEGKTKVLVPGPENQQLTVTFKDTATAFNAEKVATIEGKGALNAEISARLFDYLEANGLKTCFIAKGSQPNELIYQALTILPIEIIVRNVAWGSLCKRFPFYTEGERLSQPLVEYCYKSDSAGDPPVPEALIAERGWLPQGLCLEQVERLALQVNEALITLFSQCTIDCADFKLEMGINADGELLIADELSPDSFRLRDAQTGQILDKDVFRLDKGDLAETYQTVLSRLKETNTSLESNTQRSYEVIVLSGCKANVLHPESRTVQQALHTMGYTEVETLSVGKRFSLTLKASSMQQAEQRALAMAEELLANPVIEDFRVETISSLQDQGA